MKSIELQTTVEQARELASKLGVLIEVSFTPGNMFSVRVDGVDMYEEGSMYSYDTPFPIKTKVQVIMDELNLIQEEWSQTCFNRMMQALRTMSEYELQQLQKEIINYGKE